METFTSIGERNLYPYQEFSPGRKIRIIKSNTTGGCFSCIEYYRRFYEKFFEGSGSFFGIGLWIADGVVYSAMYFNRYRVYLGRTIWEKESMYKRNIE